MSILLPFAAWMRARRAARLAMIVFAAVFLTVCALAATLASGVRDAEARGFDGIRVATVRASELPRGGREVLASIRAGGPFASRRDGIDFGNRERILPIRPRGYYAEYTVPTPGERTRGARRIIAGQGNTGDFRTSGEYYYTDDHYRSFKRIVQ